ncbi:FxLYD domain-containing protein [Rhizobium rhizogenes]|uniref:FxLYD domain-containing protein n=1 Tax=Rhizobium rhizogenes TaxID=359 RepID=UPI00226EF038|nr:FxLYD domain-containing protein [Rhizobium rhizogenes]
MGAFRHRPQQAGLVYDLIPPERGSGPGQVHHFTPKPDIVDAEFVTVSGRSVSGANRRHGGPLRAKLRPQPARRTMLSRALATLRFIEEILQQASRRSFVALIVSLAVLIFGLSGGFSGLSDTTGEMAGEPLQFEHVTLTPRDENGLGVLTLNGIIENVSGATLSVPPIRANLFAGDQLVRSVVVNVPIDRLAPHESRGFSTRLQHPGGKTPDVRLTFMP